MTISEFKIRMERQRDKKGRTIFKVKDKVGGVAVLFHLPLYLHKASILKPCGSGKGMDVQICETG